MPNDRPLKRSSHFIEAATLVGLAVSFWWWRILAPATASGPIGSLCSDLYTQYIPVLARAADEIRNGQLPLWNPDQLAGVPALPSWLQFGGLYPLNALFLVFPPHTALGWTACLHLVVAGAGMYWLARSLDLSAAAARLAAVTCMLSQPLAVQPNLFTAMTLVPAVLASWVVLVKRPGRRALAAAAALAALQFTTGGTQIVVYTIYALALLLPWVFLILPPERRRWQAVTGAVLAGILALGLVAAVLLPTTSTIELSSRATGRLTLADTVPLPTPTLKELGLQLLTPTPGPPRIFFGWTALLLALAGFARPPRKSAWPAALLIALLGTVLVLGPNTPAYALYYQLPTGDWFRSPERAAVLIGIGVSLLAAHGIDVLQRRGWRLAASVLVLLPAFELFRATSNWLPYPQVRPASFFAPPPALDDVRAAAGSGRAYIALNWQDRFPFMEKLGTWRALPVAQDYDSLTPAVYGNYFRALLGSSAIVDPIFAGRYHPAFDGPIARRALNMLAVNLIVIAPGAEVHWMGNRQSAPPGTKPVLLENRTALPRAYIVHRVKSVTDQGEALQQLAELRFDPASTAIVIGGKQIDLGAERSGSQVELVRVDTDEVRLNARTDRAGLLVLDDLMFPGWEATVDGTPAPIFRTNGLFRGVYLESGEHVVEMTYKPPGLALGLWVTGLSLAILGVLVLRGSA